MEKSTLSTTANPGTPEPLTSFPGQKVMHEVPMPQKSNIRPILLGVVVVVAGIASGWALAQNTSAKKGSPAPTSNVTTDTKNSGGAVDEKIFPDNAEGTLHEGGLNGEGTHYLDTGAGEEKYVYLLSTVIDLQSFVGKKVQVWGQTLAAEHVGWLMDVGKVKVIE